MLHENGELLRASPRESDTEGVLAQGRQGKEGQKDGGKSHRLTLHLPPWKRTEHPSQAPYKPAFTAPEEPR